MATLIEDASNMRAESANMIDRTYALNPAEAPIDNDGYVVIIPDWCTWIEWSINTSPTLSAVLLVARTIGDRTIEGPPPYPAGTQAPNVIAIPFAVVNQSQPPLRTAWPIGFQRIARFRIETDSTDEPVLITARYYTHPFGLACPEWDALMHLLGRSGCSHAR